MKLILALCLLGVALALPQKKRLGNPDEWGPYYQGDMRFKEGQSRNGLIDESFRWPNGQVAYEFAPAFEVWKIPTVQKAMDSYAELTDGCIQFVPRTNEANYISFAHTDSGCWSYVGMQGGKQQINYPEWCINQYGSVQHEMYHALGFFHEQSRPDRDDYVDIKWANIEIGTEGNFLKYDTDYVTTFGQPYDYTSVMHYSGYAFSANGEITIETLDPAYQDVIGQRDGLSEVDINKLLIMYNCPGAPSKK